MIDYSTLNQERLAKKPLYNLPPTYTLGSMGNACTGDPPGHPSYFLQDIYTRHGNRAPNPAPAYVIKTKGGILRAIRDWPHGTTNREYLANRETALLGLYVPPPYDSERVQLWVLSQFQYFRGCYYDAEADGTQDEILIFPVPSYELKRTHIDDRWKDEVIAAYKEADEKANRAVLEHAEKVAVPENHVAHRKIKRFFPEHTIERTIELIENPQVMAQEDWWQREVERPSEDECRTTGDWLISWQRHPQGAGKHCLRCGRNT